MFSLCNKQEYKIRALYRGAKHVLIKTFRQGEWLASIRSAIRGASNESNTPLIISGDLQIDLPARVVKKNNETIKLTATEYTLLALFIKNEGKVLTHQYLLREVWGPGYINQSQYLRVFIAQLRKKIETDPTHPECIVTESGVGYRFVSAE